MKVRTRRPFGGALAVEGAAADGACAMRTATGDALAYPAQRLEGRATRRASQLHHARRRLLQRRVEQLLIAELAIVDRRGRRRPPGAPRPHIGRDTVARRPAAPARPRRRQAPQRRGEMGQLSRRSGWVVKVREQLRHGAPLACVWRARASTPTGAPRAPHESYRARRASSIDDAPRVRAADRLHDVVHLGGSVAVVRSDTKTPYSLAGVLYCSQGPHGESLGRGHTRVVARGRCLAKPLHDAHRGLFDATRGGEGPRQLERGPVCP